MSLSSLESGQRAFEAAEAAGISSNPQSTPFADKVLSWLQQTPEHGDVVRRLTSALERTLQRNHDDARLIMTLTYTLQHFSGLEAEPFHKKLGRSMRLLDKPAAASVVKTLKQSSVASVHEKILDIKDLDTIAVLSQIPNDQVKVVSENRDILLIGDEEIDLASSSKKDIQTAVKKVKAAQKKSAPKTPKVKAERDEPLLSYEPLEGHDSSEFESPVSAANEWDEAALALSKLLRTLPREGALSNLATVIEEARALIELTKQKLMSPHQDSSDESIVQADFH